MSSKYEATSMFFHFVGINAASGEKVEVRVQKDPGAEYIIFIDPTLPLTADDKARINVTKFPKTQEADKKEADKKKPFSITRAKSTTRSSTALNKSTSSRKPVSVSKTTTKVVRCNKKETEISFLSSDSSIAEVAEDVNISALDDVKNLNLKDDQSSSDDSYVAMQGFSQESFGVRRRGFY